MYLGVQGVGGNKADINNEEPELSSATLGRVEMEDGSEEITLEQRIVK